ncbi:MAG: hypothetical protein EBQ95_03435 [Gammaproteobacteria bacterium]|nr:hypothetical protein [Gammaproteobacteria bacterium]
MHAFVEFNHHLSLNIYLLMSSSKKMNKGQAGFIVLEGLLVLVLLGLLMAATLEFYQRFQSALRVLIPS